MEKLVYSPKQKIPLFRLTSNSASERIVEVEFLNVRHKEYCERIRVSKIIIYLVEEEMKLESEDEKMIHTPVYHIPMGILQKDEKGVYLEVKFKKNKERIRLTTYLALMLESQTELLMAS